MDCDSIVVMDEGRVVEQGSHDELMKAGGRYSELVVYQRRHASLSHEEDGVVVGDGGVLEEIESANEEAMIL